MIYIIGLVGFVGGFALGQLVLLRLLKNRSRDDLLEDKSLQRKYGSLNWLFALTGMASMLYVYTHWGQ